MSENLNNNGQNPDQTPDGGEGQTPDVQQGQADPQGSAAAPDAGGQSQQAGQPFAVFPDAESFNRRLARETRKRLDTEAQAAGFETWQALLDSRAPAPAQPESQAGDQSPPAQPESPDEAARLRLSIVVGGDKGLPPALLSRLVGNTREELEADADRLLAVVQASTSRGPGIPRAPQGEQTTTFTRAQLQNPAFVREHAAEIQQAAREGRIADA